MRPNDLCHYGPHECRVIKADPAGFSRYYITARATDGTICAGPDSDFTRHTATVIPLRAANPPAAQTPLPVPTHPTGRGNPINGGAA